MNQLGSNHTITPPINPFMDPNLTVTLHFALTKWPIVKFLEAYSNDPSQYDNQEPIDLIHPDLLNNLDNILQLAARMGSIQLFKFIIGTGLIGQLSNQQFIRNCFRSNCLSSYTLTKYLIDLSPYRISLIPANIILSLLISHSEDLKPEVIQLFWDYCPRLRDDLNFLNSEIRIPSLDTLSLINIATRCLNDGGYSGDLSSRELEEKYQVSFLKNNYYLINFLLPNASIPLLESFIKNSNINILPLFDGFINPGVDHQDDQIRKLIIGKRKMNVLKHQDDSRPLDAAFPQSQDDSRSLAGSFPESPGQDDSRSSNVVFPQFLEQLFYLPMRFINVLSIESVLWYFNWWKNDLLKDSLLLDQFNMVIFRFLNGVGNGEIGNGTGSGINGIGRGINGFSVINGINGKQVLTNNPLSNPQSEQFRDDLVIKISSVKFLGNNFFSTLSSDQIFLTLDNIFTHYSRNDEIFPLIDTLLSIPSISNNIKEYCVYFTRISLRKNLMWDCANLFLKLGGLTMDQVWTDSVRGGSDAGRSDGTNGGGSNGDSNGIADGSTGDVFTLRTLILPYSESSRLLLPLNFVQWLYNQSGTQEQLIKMIQSKEPWLCVSNGNQNNDLDGRRGGDGGVNGGNLEDDDVLRRLLLLMSFSCHQQVQERRQNERQQQEYPNLISPLRPKQSISWLQSLIVYAPIDYMNVNFAFASWNRPRAPPPATISLSSSKTDQNTKELFGLCHISLTIDKWEDDGHFCHALLLEEIIQGVIMSLLVQI